MALNAAAPAERTPAQFLEDLHASMDAAEETFEAFTKAGQGHIAAVAAVRAAVRVAEAADPGLKTLHTSVESLQDGLHFVHELTDGVGYTSNAAKPLVKASLHVLADAEALKAALAADAADGETAEAVAESGASVREALEAGRVLAEDLVFQLGALDLALEGMLARVSDAQARAASAALPAEAAEKLRGIGEGMTVAEAKVSELLADARADVDAARDLLRALDQPAAVQEEAGAGEGEGTGEAELDAVEADVLQAAEVALLDEPAADVFDA